MRILTIISDLGVRGTQRAAQTFSLAYQRAGHEVAVLAHGGDGPRRRVLENAGISVFIGDRQRECALVEAVHFRADVIHIHRQGNFNARELAILQRLRHEDRAVLETNVFGRVDYSDCAKLIDVHMPVSLFCLWQWQQRLGRRRKDQVGALMSNPFDSAGFERCAPQERLRQRLEWGIREESYICGHVGFSGLSRIAIDGFRRLASYDPSAWLVCVGVSSQAKKHLGSLPDTIKRRTMEIATTNDDASLSRIYSTFDCLIHASTVGETFGYVLAEALSCGVPIVGLSCPHHGNGHLEVIGHGEGGLIAGSSKHFADAMFKLQGDKGLRSRVLREGHERIRRLFDADLIAARALRVAGYALAHRDRKDLRRALEEDPILQTTVDDRSILELASNTLGGPSARELALMRLVNSPAGQRLVRLLRHRELLALRP